MSKAKNMNEGFRESKFFKKSDTEGYAAVGQTVLLYQRKVCQWVPAQVQ